MPEMPDVVSGEVIESEWGNAIRSRTVQRYASITERSALNATPEAGDLSYLEDLGRVDFFHAGIWQPIHNETGVNQTVNSGGSIGTAFATLASHNLTIPSSWTTAYVTAWGSVLAVRSGGGVGTVEARIQIAGENGTSFTAPFTVPSSGSAGITVAVGHRRANMTPGVALITLDARRTGDTVTHQSVLTASVSRQT